MAFLFGISSWQSDQIPDMENAQLGEVEEAIAVKFFGEDAYNNTSAPVRLVKEDILEFVRTLLSYLWNQVRNATRDQLIRLEKGKVEVIDEYESMSILRMLHR
jgi:hypothetical protein